MWSGRHIAYTLDVKLAIKTRIGHLTFVATPVLQIFDNGLIRKEKYMPFAVPMVWRNPTDHISDCYCCMTPPVSKGLSRKKKHGIQYPNIPSAIRPVPHGEILPVPKAFEKYTLDSDEQKIESSEW